MISDIENEVRCTQNMIGKDTLDARVMIAMGECHAYSRDAN